MADEFHFEEYDWSKKQKVGSGAFGVVFKVHCKTNNEEVAIKQMDMSVINKDPFLLSSLKNEISVMGELQGEPYVIQLHEAHFGKKYTYLIMDLCDSDLRKKMDKNGGKLSEVQAIFGMTQMMKGIKCMVDKGYIHRDLKPENTLIKGNTYKISDFGFVVKADIKGMKKLEDVCGTPLYMAPQLLSDKSYTSKSDIWSLGIILFEMIFGYAPWPCRSLQTYRHNILNTPLAFPYNAKLGENTKDFIKKCLVVNEEKRISWEQIFNHPLIKDKEIGQQADNVKLPIEVIDILRKMQEKAKKNNIDIMDALASTAQDSHVDQKKFNHAVQLVDPAISQIQKRMLFFALGTEKEGVGKGQELKNILAENDFRDVDDVSARLEAQLMQVIKLKKLEVKELFRGFDKNKTGSVDFFQFKSMLKQLMPGLTEDNFRKLWNKFDRNKSGDISLTEFISAIEIANSHSPSYFKRIRVEKARRGLESLKKAISLYKVSVNDLLKHFDKDKDGKIDYAQFGKLVVCIDKYVKDDELKEIYMLLDDDNSGFVTVAQMKNHLFK